MKLNELTTGQRFRFLDKHRGKVFEVTIKGQRHVVYMDVATNQERATYANRKAFRMEVELVTEDRTITLTQHEVDTLTFILWGAYLGTEVYAEQTRSDINKLFLKVTGLPGWRPDIPDGEPTTPEFPSDRKGGVL